MRSSASSVSQMTNARPEPKHCRAVYDVLESLAPDKEAVKRFRHNMRNGTCEYRLRMYTSAIYDGLVYGNWPTDPGSKREEPGND